MTAIEQKGLMSLTKTKAKAKARSERDKVDGYFECECRYVMFLVRQDRRTVVNIVIADGMIQLYIQNLSSSQPDGETTTGIGIGLAIEALTSGDSHFSSS
jgi:hypothetical protein